MTITTPSGLHADIDLHTLKRLVRWRRRADAALRFMVLGSVSFAVLGITSAYILQSLSR